MKRITRTRRTYGAPLIEIRKYFLSHGVEIIKEHCSNTYWFDYEHGNIWATAIDRDYWECGITLRELKRLYYVLNERL